MMDDQEQLAISETLAKAQGWERIPASKGSPASYVDENGKWMNWADGWDPSRHADDLLALLEWARKQEWWDYLGIGSCAIVLLGHDGEFEGSFQESFPLAVYTALKEVENAEV